MWRSLFQPAGKGGTGGRPPIDENNRNQLLLSAAITIGGLAAFSWVMMGGSAPEITWKEFSTDYLAAGQVCLYLYFIFIYFFLLIFRGSSLPFNYNKYNKICGLDTCKVQYLNLSWHFKFYKFLPLVFKWLVCQCYIGLLSQMLQRQYILS